MSDSELATIAYRAYGSVTDFKNYQGLPMPEWDQLPPKIQEAWRAATRVVAVEVGTAVLFDEAEEFDTT